MPGAPISLPMLEGIVELSAGTSSSNGLQDLAQTRRMPRFKLNEIMERSHCELRIVGRYECSSTIEGLRQRIKPKSHTFIPASY